MGSSASRGKRVAPACVSEVTVAKSASPKPDERLFRPLKIHNILRNARNRAEDCHSEGRDSEEDEEELDTVIAGTFTVAPPRKAVIRSRTYGLCHFSRDEEEELGSEGPCGSDGGSTGVNKRTNDAFTPLKKHTSVSKAHHNSSSQAFLTRVSLLEAVPTPEKQSTPGSCHSSSLTMPVILYDGSEEELMDTIEREFS